jgi:hypothetical protein
MRQIDQQAGVEEQREFDAVPCHARLVAQRLILELPARPHPNSFDIGGFEIGRRANVHFAGGAVHNDGVA